MIATARFEWQQVIKNAERAKCVPDWLSCGAVMVETDVAMQQDSSEALDCLL